MHGVRQQVERNGFAVIPACVSEDTIRTLAQALDDREHGVRNLLANRVVRNFAESEEVMMSVTSVLAIARTGCFCGARHLFQQELNRKLESRLASGQCDCRS